LNEDKLKGQGLAVPLPAGLDLTTAALGLRVTRDTTDSPFYPRRGSVVDITLDFFDAAFGAQLSYQNVNVAFNKYQRGRQECDRNALGVVRSHKRRSILRRLPARTI
jgi:outer membrane protein assembly factor BamA